MSTFTVVHVIISLAGILSGFVVVAEMLATKHHGGWAATFLATTAATSITGFFFPIHGFTPALGLGILSLLVLIVACVALYGRHLAGAWRRTYVISAVLALYFNFFVLIVQAFRRVPALNALAPTQSEPPFAIAQGIALVVFIALGVAAFRRFSAERVYSN
jgi:hypothetical protein